MNNEALRKWNPVFDTMDPKQILDIADRGYLAEFAEQFSFSLLQNSMHMMLPNGLQPPEILPAFFKAILYLKTKYKFEFLFNRDTTITIPTDTVIGEFIKPVYINDTDVDTYYNAIIEKLEEL